MGTWSEFKKFNGEIALAHEFAKQDTELAVLIRLYAFYLDTGDMSEANVYICKIQERVSDIYALNMTVDTEKVLNI